MSRARLFKRAADWLKNCIQTKEKIAEAKDRQRAFRFAFGQLEERVVLDADFTFDGINLVMDNYTSMGSEALNVSDTGTHFEFALAEGVWSGIDGADAFGNGTDTLSLAKAALPLSITSDGGGIDTNFETVDFDSALLFDVSFTGGAITQTGAITASSVDAQFNGDSIDLFDPGNTFLTLDVTSVGDISIAEANGIDIVVNGAGPDIVVAAENGDINFVGGASLVGSNISLFTGGGNGNVSISDVDASTMSVDAGTGNIDASDMNNDLDQWTVFNAGNVEIFDVDDLELRTISATSLDVNAGDVVQSDDHITVDQAFFDVNTFDQSGLGSIITPELTMDSAGDVMLSNGANFIVSVAGSVGGNLNLVNSVNLAIDELTFGAITTTGLNVIGDVDIEMVDLDLVSVEPIAVGGALNLTMGIGCVDFSNASNDFNTLNIISAGEAEIFDGNDLGVLGAEISDQAAFVALGALNLDGDITVANTLLLGAVGDVSQNAGIISTSGLMVDAFSNATLDGLNQIGSAGVDGLLSANVAGDFVVQNVFGIDLADQTYMGKFLIFSDSGLDVSGEACLHVDSLTSSSATFEVGSLLVDSNNGFAPSVDVIADDLILIGSGLFDLSGSNEIARIATDIDGDLILNNEIDIEIADLTLCGTQVVGMGVTGDLTMMTSDDSVTQTAAATVGGASQFTLGIGSATLDNTDNDFNIVNIVSADVAEIVEFDGFTLNDAMLTDRLILETVAGDLGLSGAIVAPNGLLLISGGAIVQSAGTVDAATLLVESAGDAVLDQLNSIGTGLPAGVIAGASGGDFIVTNSLASLVGTVTINRKDGTPVTLMGIDALNVKLTALQILVNEATTAIENIVLDSQDGVNQNANGILTAAGLVLSGDGDFDLTQANEIGTLVDAGKFAADVLGSISLTNLYGLLIAKISCGTMVYTGVNLGAGTGSGDLSINTTANNGSVDQEADAPIMVSGVTRFNVGTGTICLTKGDSDSDSMTNNDLNSLFIDSASIAEIADVNGLVTEDIVGVESISLEAGGAIQLNKNLEADLVRLKAGDGVTQAASTFLVALELLLEGEGDFVLTEGNRIGSTFTEGKIAANIAGSLTLFNSFDLLIDEVSYEFKDATTASFAGINIDVGGSTGNLTLTNSNDDIRQSMLGSVVVLGMTSIDAGSGSIYLNMSTGNNFVEFEAINSSEVELSDSVDDLLVGDVNASTQALLISSGMMSLDGNINAGDRLMTVSNGGVRQGFFSTLVASELLVAGVGDFTFDRSNTIQSPTTLVGNIAVDVDGTFELANANETVVSSLLYAQKRGQIWQSRASMLPVTSPSRFLTQTFTKTRMLRSS